MNGNSKVDRAIDALAKGPKEYDADVAYLCSVISAWCYADTGTLELVLGRKEWWAGRPMRIDAFSMRNPALMIDSDAFLVHFGPKREEQLHVLAFRGTEPTDIVDWLTDALVEWHVWKEPQWVHRGFFLGLDVLWSEIADKLAELRAPLVITGHSLGGALAALAARRFADERGDTVAAYTFGQPMVGNDAFARASHGETLFRHVYEGDLVARLPPTLLCEGYRHYGVVLHPGDAGAAAGQAKSSAWPPPCHLPDLPPALLSLVTARSPMLRELLGPVTFFTGLPGSVYDWLGQLARFERPEMLDPCSFDDHMPSHYVDVSKQSARGHGETANPQKAGKRWVMRP